MDDVRFRVNMASGSMQPCNDAALPEITFFGNPTRESVYIRLSSHLLRTRGLCAIGLSDTPHLQLLLQPDVLTKIPTPDIHSPPRPPHPCALRTVGSEGAMSLPQRPSFPDTNSSILTPNAESWAVNGGEFPVKNRIFSNTSKPNKN
jgi:hypothetical protein